MRLEFKEKLTLLVLGFCLTGVIGAGLNYWIQCKLDSRAQAQRLFEYKIKRFDSFRDGLAFRLDSRLYLTRRVLDETSEPSRDPKRLERYIEEYRRSIREWNSNLSFHILETNLFSTELHSLFKAMHVDYLTPLSKKLDEELDTLIAKKYETNTGDLTLGDEAKKLLNQEFKKAEDFKHCFFVALEIEYRAALQNQQPNFEDLSCMAKS